MDDVPFPSSQGRSSSASSFRVSLLHVINGVVSVVLYPQVASQAPQHSISFCVSRHPMQVKVDQQFKEAKSISLQPADPQIDGVI